MNTWLWELLTENCTGCGICLDVCQEEAIHMPREAAYPAPAKDKCIGCEVCVQECPFDAIKLTEVI